MRAVVIEKFGGREILNIKEVDRPVPGEGEVLVKIHAAGINPVDWKIREGRLKERGYPHQFPVILGWDMAGVVEAFGHGARRFAVGDKVFAYARRPVIHQGTYADYICLPESYLAVKPTNLSFVEAACVPLAALTAYQSLFDAARLKKKETIFILGASGGVGSFAVQMAKITGAKVIALASQKNHAYLKRIGAGKTLDYQKGDFVKELKKIEPKGVDVVFSCVGGENLTKGYDCVRAGGRLVTIVEKGDEALAGSKGVKLFYVFVEPNSRQLDQIRRWIEQKKIKVRVSLSFMLDDVKKAHEQIETGHTRGKIALKIT